MRPILLICSLFPVFLYPFSWADDWRCSVGVAAFCPSSERFCDIYGSALIDYELRATKAIGKDYDLWLEATALAKTGLSYAGDLVSVESSTRVWMESLNAGFAYRKKLLRCIDGYVGIGPSYLFLHVHNNNPYLSSTLSDNGFGFLAKIGLVYSWRRICVDLFADYLYAPLNFAGDEVVVSQMNVGGWKVGGAVGLRF